MDDMRIYLKTSNQEIIDEVKKYDRNKLELHKKWGEFQDKYHVKLIGWNKHYGSIMAYGVIGDTSTLPGQWRKPDHHNVSSPFKRNKEGWEMLSSMSLKAPNLGEEIPHLTLESLPDEDISYFINTVFFEHDGSVYVSCGSSAKPDQKVWTRINKWEFDRAEEEKNKA